MHNIAGYFLKGNNIPVTFHSYADPGDHQSLNFLSLKKRLCVLDGDMQELDALSLHHDNNMYICIVHKSYSRYQFHYLII